MVWCYHECTFSWLTHRGRMIHICVGNLTIIGLDNGLSPGRCQAIILTNARILLIGPLGTNFSEILIEIHTFSFKKMHLKRLSAKWRPFCLGLNEARQNIQSTIFKLPMSGPHGQSIEASIWVFRGRSDTIIIWRVHLSWVVWSVMSL